MRSEWQKNTKALFLFLFIFIFNNDAYSQQQDAQPTATPQKGIQVIQIGNPSQPSTSPISPQTTQQIEQRKAVQAEMEKTGGVLTPEAIEQLKSRPEFKGLTPEDILRGKELLEKKREPEKKEPPKVIEKTVISTEAEKRKSLFDRYRVIGEYQDISTGLMPFGYEFFTGATVKVLTQRQDIPVPSDYIVGPGDEVKILLWGRVNAQYNLVIDRDGNITIPQIGPLTVAGMRFDTMKNYLMEQAEQIVGANINVTMGALKSIPIFVLGEVRRPGSYTIGSFSTITDALLLSGGPTEIGSLRNIQLKRKDKVISVLDFYDLLLKGDKSQDKILQAGDVVFVQTAGPLVGVAGNVKRPAIYELKDRFDLMSLFDLAGGIIPTAYTQQIQVERIQKNEKQVVIDIDDKDLTKSKDFILQDADLVKVFPIVDKDVNVVYLYGNLKRPGKYEYKEGMKVKNLIKDSNELLPETHFEYALIKRLNPPGLETHLIPFNLGALLLKDDASNNIELMPQDFIYVFSKWFFKDKPFITVEGEVRKGSRFNLDEKTRVKDAILLAGGLTKDAYLEKGEIIRLNEKREASQVYFNVGLAMAEDPKENLSLQDEDRIIIHSLWEEKYKHTVSIEGDVLKPGQYQLVKDMEVSDLIFAAGNILESAFLDEAEISSHIIIDSGRAVRIDYRKIDLRKALAGDPAHNIVLKPYDRLFVKRIPDWRIEKFVVLSGEVKFPGKYIVKKGERFSSVLERAGGFTDKAYLKGAVFVRESVRSLQQRMLDEYISRLEKDLLAASTTEVAAALSPDEAKIKQTEMQQKRELITKLKGIRPQGRMVIHLSRLERFKESISDIELEDGDSLFIPARPSSVNVIGSVYNQTAFLYNPEASLSQYISLAGGPTEFADTKRTYVLKTDGSAIAPDQLRGWGINWNEKNYRWEVADYSNTRLDPGDTIVVPEKIERIAWLREIKDITQILFQMAVTAGVLIALF
ncbi:MAG: SLBB domain-containing protein [Nitrospirota bacterium]